MPMNQLPFKSGICPVSGLQIIAKDQWKCVTITDRFTDSFYLIGSSILYTIPEGYAELKAIEGFRNLYDSLIKSSGFHPSVHIHDFSRFQGNNKEARQAFIDFYIGQKDLLGVIFINLPFHQKLTLELVKRMRLINFKLILSQSYREAVKEAIRLLNVNISIPEKALPPIELPSDHSGTVQEAYEKEIQGFCSQVQTRPEWKNVQLDKSYTMSAFVLRGEILYIVVYGHSTGKGLEKAVSITDEIIKESFPDGKKFIFIEDFTFLKTVNIEVRRKYIEYYARNEKIRGLIFVHPLPMIEFMIKLARKILRVPFSVEIASDFYDALNMVNRMSLDINPEGLKPLKAEKTIIKGYFRSLFSNPVSRLLKPYVQKEVEQEIEKYKMELETYLNDFNWENQSSFLEKLDKKHPFYTLFEAINIMKSDLDFLAKEQLKKDHQEEPPV